MSQQMEVVTEGPALEAVRGLFQEYVGWLNVDLSFQDFDRELRELPGDYVAPAGTLLLLRDGGSAAGCVAMRRWDARTAEMKRLFVRGQHRGRGYGRLLAERAIAWARTAGYSRILLDTLPTMGEAQRMYERLGFRDVAAYRFNPVEGARFLELELGGAALPK